MKNFIVKSESAQYFECGFSCDNAIVLVADQTRWFITDSRYTVEANEYCKDTIVLESGDLVATLRKIIRSTKERGFAVDPNEWSFGSLKALTDKLSHINFTHKKDLSPLKRAIKSDSEIALIRAAVRENEQAFASFAEYLISSGEDKSEKELHYQARGFLENFGNRELSFNPIFAINANGAKPHALVTDQRLRYGDIVLFDAGTKHARYCSDRTRTAQFGDQVSFGFDQRFDDSLRQKVYDIVLKAHDEAIKKARVGMKAKELDSIARGVIEDAGYGKFFTHSLGHGVGLDIHEYPYINRRSEMVLQENMVFTIEPGIYLPDQFGVRIESVVALTSSRAEIL